VRKLTHDTVRAYAFDFCGFISVAYSLGTPLTKLPAT